MFLTPNKGSLCEFRSPMEVLLLYENQNMLFYNGVKRVRPFWMEITIVRLTFISTSQLLEVVGGQRVGTFDKVCGSRMRVWSEMNCE